MAQWTAFPHDAADYTFDAAALKKNWARLHAGDAEPLPTDAKVLAAWSLFHAGSFQKATEAGLKAGEKITAINGKPIGDDFFGTPAGRWNLASAGTPVTLTLEGGRTIRFALADFY